MSIENYEDLLHRADLIIKKAHSERTTEDNLILLVLDAVDVLYPNADPSGDWDPDTLEELSLVFRQFRPN